MDRHDLSPSPSPTKDRNLFNLPIQLLAVLQQTVDDGIEFNIPDSPQIGFESFYNLLLLTLQPFLPQSMKPETQQKEQDAVAGERRQAFPGKEQPYASGHPGQGGFPSDLSRGDVSQAMEADSKNEHCREQRVCPDLEPPKAAR
jgi:hypothetical protein